MGYLTDIKTQLEARNVHCEFIQVGTHLGGEQLVAYDPTHSHSKTASVMTPHGWNDKQWDAVYVNLGDFDTLRQTRKILRASDSNPLGVSMIILAHFGVES